MRRPTPRDPKPTAAALSRALRAAANPAHAVILQRFFKTGPGQYGEGDVFIGLKVPVTRKLVREFRDTPDAEALRLLRSPVHEERLAALLLWVDAHQRGDGSVKRRILRRYLENARYVNNWDLVDLSAPQIVGGTLDPRAVETRELLDRLAGSPLLWERRIAVVATHAWIRAGEFGPTLRLCRKLLGERHDLMHKACGWMLRETGKRDRGVLRRFLDAHAGVMPRTMLRYALEHFGPRERARYLRQGGKAGSRKRQAPGRARVKARARP